VGLLRLPRPQPVPGHPSDKQSVRRLAGAIVERSGGRPAVRYSRSAARAAAAAQRLNRHAPQELRIALGPGAASPDKLAAHNRAPSLIVTCESSSIVRSQELGMPPHQAGRDIQRVAALGCHERGREHPLTVVRASQLAAVEALRASTAPSIPHSADIRTEVRRRVALSSVANGSGRPHRHRSNRSARRSSRVRHASVRAQNGTGAGRRRHLEA
jgi:hypothetical protein